MFLHPGIELLISVLIFDDEPAFLRKKDGIRFNAEIIAELPTPDGNQISIVFREPLGR
jgi:hypothetical protein